MAAVLGEPLLSRFDLIFDYSDGRLWLKQLPHALSVPFNRSGCVTCSDLLKSPCL